MNFKFRENHSSKNYILTRKEIHMHVTDNWLDKFVKSVTDSYDTEII